MENDLKERQGCRLRTPLHIAVLVVGLLAAACGPGPVTDPVHFSLLAIGDAGAAPDNPVDYARMLEVARAMSDEDAERPVDALVFLGDNFYPSGLLRSELVDRVRANLTRPFCRFVESGGSRHAEVADVCPNGSHVVPILAVLGNHDYASPHSPDLQRNAVPEFVSNWQMPDSLAETREFPNGVSVILFDAERIVAGQSAEPLVNALRSSAGPWRILAGHRPISTLGALGDRAQNAAYAAVVRGAIEKSGVTVQLVLAGHEHRLAILQMDAPDPPLHVISGGGSDRRKQRVVEPRVRAEFKSLGFVRVDLHGEADATRLSVSVLRVHRYPWIRWFDNRILAARFTVDLAGRVREI